MRRRTNLPWTWLSPACAGARYALRICQLLPLCVEAVQAAPERRSRPGRLPRPFSRRSWLPAVFACALQAPKASLCVAPLSPKQGQRVDYNPLSCSFASFAAAVFGKSSTMERRISNAVAVIPLRTYVSARFSRCFALASGSTGAVAGLGASF